MFANGESIQQEECAARSGATGKRFDTLGGQRLQTLRAGRIWPAIGASRLDRSTATIFADPLDPGPNPPRQNGSYLSPDALGDRGRASRDWCRRFLARVSAFRQTGQLPFRAHVCPQMAAASWTAKSWQGTRHGAPLHHQENFTWQS